MASRASAKVSTDHDEIRRWAEERGAKPSCVRGTGGPGDIGMLRLDFPGYSGGQALQEISWDDWFQKFDELGLALLHQEQTARGQKSNFNKLIARDTAEARAEGETKVSVRRGRASSQRVAGARRTTSARASSGSRAASRRSRTVSARSRSQAGNRRRTAAKRTTTARSRSASTAKRRTAGRRRSMTTARATSTRTRTTARAKRAGSTRSAVSRTRTKAATSRRSTSTRARSNQGKRGKVIQMSARRGKRSSHPRKAA